MNVNFKSSIDALILLATCFTVVFGQCPPVNKTCELEKNCFCPGTVTPAGLDSKEIPQIVYLTFDDAITAENYKLYDQLLFSRKNPNDALVSSTFFISHEYNDYQLTHDLYRKGHEIGLHSITHKADTTYWRTMNYSMWIAEVYDQKLQLSHLSKVPIQKIHGFRTPQLQPGGDRMYQALVEADLEYDCSLPTRVFAGPNPILWPYTNDYNLEHPFQDCVTEPCPTGNYPGFWTVPMVVSFGNNSFPCTMIDSCLPQPTTREQTLHLLKSNFVNHYLGNRAPYGVFTHASWLQGEDNIGRLNGYADFLDHLGTLPDVYIVSITKSLEWMRNPVGLDEIADFVPWQDEPTPINECSFAFPCFYSDSQTPFPGIRNMQCCVGCPQKYPWIHNPFGENIIT